ncbi:MAG TPA: PilW family protein [Steroidobacteraceae bacterium]|nr:PilW family protein [Steroidobacteraceae bacterium]
MRTRSAATTRIARRSAAPSARALRGFTLVEIMIAIVIGLFLTGGLLTLVQAMKRTFIMQSAMSQLQDNERMAMTLIADVIQSAGYFPQPNVNTPALLMPSVGPFATAGQSIVGTGAGTAVAPGDTITVRYVTWGTNNGDQTINCTGGTSPIQLLLTNQFGLQADPNVPGTYDLICSLNGAPPVVLVNGIANLQIYYGVATNPDAASNSVDTYLDANGVTNWSRVLSVKVTLTFVNPLYGTLPGQSTVNTPQTIPFTRVVDVMNKGGITT